MSEKFTKGEMHGCIVCGKLYDLYVVYDSNGKYIDCKVMSAGGSCVKDAKRPLVACDIHSTEQIEGAVMKAYGNQEDDD